MIKLKENKEKIQRPQMNTCLSNKRIDAKVQPSSRPLFDIEDPNQSREESKGEE